LKELGKIYFDLDGTVYDLYAVEDWDYKLRHSDTSVFTDGKTMTDMVELGKRLVDREVAVITWLPKESTKEYRDACTQVKVDWVHVNMPYVKEIHVLEYGTPKHSIGSIEDILVDDNAKVLEDWIAAGRKAIDAKYIDTIDEKIKEVI
jgi:5'(3')-deoxyribonucleotidase